MKKPDFFAQDVTDTITVIPELNALLRAHPDWYWAALVDGAFDYPEADQAPYAASGTNCYLLDAFEGLEAAAPWLVPLSAPETDQTFLKKLIRHCQGRPMLSFVASHQPITTLKNEWASLHWIDTRDAQRMLLRVADTRVLPELPRVLTNEQWKAFTAPLALWLLIDRQGNLAACPLAPEDATADTKIQLTQAQLDALLQAAEPDAVIDLLAENMPELLPTQLRKSQLHEYIHTSCTLAQTHQVATFADIVSLAVAACLTGGASNDDARLHALLDGGQWDSGKLGDALLAGAII